MATSLWSRLGDVASLVATPLLPSHYIELVRPLAATHTRHARVEAVHDEAPEVRTLTLRPGRAWRTHRAGQHVRVGVAIDGRIATRTYSISSSPDRHDGCITITVKAQGRASRALVHDVQPGAFVTLGLPEGEFVMTDRARPLFITAGSGITPVMSMLRTFAARGAMPDVAHLHYAGTAMIFGDELAALAAAHPTYRCMRDHQRFNAERLTALVPDWRDRETWVCGPQRLLDATAEVIPGAHVERFRPHVAPGNALGGRVRFGASGVDAIANGHTPLLQIAEHAGLNPPHGCRMGICHTCDATLVSGCVRDLRTGVQIDESGTRVQICVCAAAGDVELTL